MQIALPPYIHKPMEDPERYQTVYSRVPGSVAAPTAGLHFTPELLGGHSMPGACGRRTSRSTWGWTLSAPSWRGESGRARDPRGVFRDRRRRHRPRSTRPDMMGAELLRWAPPRCVSWSRPPSGQSEGAPRISSPPPDGRSCTSFRGHRFQVVDAMITNFHLTRTTLLMLVSAFAGRERILETYQQAIAMEYRFYSFGDCMIII